MVLGRVSVDFLALKDFMTSLDRLKEVVSSHLAIYLMNSRNSLEALKLEALGDHRGVPKLDKEEKILLFKLKLTSWRR